MAPFWQIYERVLKLPAPMVFAVVWLAGAAVLGLGGLAFYVLFRVLRGEAGA